MGSRIRLDADRIAENVSAETFLTARRIVQNPLLVVALGAPLGLLRRRGPAAARQSGLERLTGYNDNRRHTDQGA
jgi:hypothetical protein